MTTVAEHPVIEMIKISRTFDGPPRVDALREVALVIERGDYVALTGPSGSGKSTLLNLLGLLDRPSSGAYRLTGLLTTSLSDAERTAIRGRRIGIVFQDFYLLNYRTATENVALAQLYTGTPYKARLPAAQHSLDRVGLSHRRDALPTTMSGGERQRVAIARALVNEPELLLCDEPTGNLDSRTAGQMLDLLDQLNAEGVTVVVITHDPLTAARCGRQIMIKDGEVT
jgi:putative ABC transport system ATP-binding protein